MSINTSQAKLKAFFQEFSHRNNMTEPSAFDYQQMFKKSNYTFQEITPFTKSLPLLNNIPRNNPVVVKVYNNYQNQQSETKERNLLEKQKEVKSATVDDVDVKKYEKVETVREQEELHAFKELQHLFKKIDTKLDIVLNQPFSQQSTQKSIITKSIQERKEEILDRLNRKNFC